MNIKQHYLSVILSSVFLFTTSVWADQVTATFNTGETLNAAKLGDLATQINDNDNEITALQTQTAPLANACSAGSAIRSIAADGTVACEIDDNTDTNTTYTPGTGMSLVGTTFNNSSGADITVSPAFTSFGVGGSTAVTELISTTINVPSNGIVIVTFSGSAVFFGDGKTVLVGIGDTSTAIDTSSYIGRLDGAGTDRFREQYTLQYIYKVIAGTKTFYGLGQANTTFDKVLVNVSPQSLTAVFLPNRL